MGVSHRYAKLISEMQAPLVWDCTDSFLDGGLVTLRRESEHVELSEISSPLSLCGKQTSDRPEQKHIKHSDGRKPTRRDQ